MSRKPLPTETRQKVAILAANNASIAETCRQTGMHHASVKKALAEPLTQAMIETASKLLSEKMLDRANEIIDAITPEDVEKAGLRDKVVASGILYEKGRLAYGLDKMPIAIQVNNLVTPVDLSKYT
jgi:hypothetical protein